MKEFIQSIKEEVEDIFNFEILTSKSFVVPSRNDPQLTFGLGQNKRGKLIETCVLFVDIRNSTQLSRSLAKDKAQLGKIYSAFIHAMTRIADRYGFVRNIIGDRVMVVFEPSDCFNDALNCSILMNTVVEKVLKTVFKLEDFKIGIGIEYGELLILKAGIPKHEKEQSEYKNLVWVGDAANIASKLADIAGKDYSHSTFTVIYEEVKLNTLPRKNSGLFSSSLFPSRKILSSNSLFITYEETAFLTCEEFASNTDMSKIPWKYKGNKVINFVKQTKSGKAATILISGKVYNEFLTLYPDSKLILKFTKKSYPNPPRAKMGIYEGSATFN